MLKDISNRESPKVQATCLARLKEVASYAARFRLGGWRFGSPGSDQPWKCNKDRPSQQFADGAWDELALNMSEHPKRSTLQEWPLGFIKTGERVFLFIDSCWFVCSVFMLLRFVRLLIGQQPRQFAMRHSIDHRPHVTRLQVGDVKVKMF